MFVLKKYFNKLVSKVNILDVQVNNFWEKIDKLESLFKKDYHGYLRPKVDLLADELNDHENAVWKAMGELKEKIEKLEKKK